MQKSTSLIERVRRHLSALGKLEHLDVRPSGADAVQVVPAKGRGEKAIARVTALGHGAFGLTFRANEDRWPSIALVDTFEEILTDLLATIEPPVEYETL